VVAGIKFKELIAKEKKFRELFAIFIRQKWYFGQLDQYNKVHGLTLVPEYP